MLEGAIILTVAMGIVKVLGAIYKVAMADIIGIDGNGFYSYAYTIYNLIYSIAVSGFPVAISKIVAGFAGEGRYNDIKRVKSVATLLFTAVGAVGTVGLMAFSGFYSENVLQQPLAFWSMIAVAPAILFCCLMSIYRGYNQGLRNMTPTAISQVIEVFFKVATSIVLSFWVKMALFAEYRDYGTVFGELIADEKVAEITILAYSAAGAIFGVTISTAVGFLFLFFRQKIKGDGISKAQYESSPEPFSKKRILKMIVAFSVPMALSAAAVNLTSVIDGIMVQDRLRYVFETDMATVFASHGGLMELAGKTPDMDHEFLANFLNGAYWFAMPFFTMIPAITGSFGMSALPHVATAWAVKNVEKTRKNIESTIRMAMLIAAPAGIGLACLAGPVLSLIYGDSASATGFEIAIPMLRVLGIAAIFVALSGPANAMLQAIGRVDIPVKLMVLGGVIKIISNYIFIGMPQFNIKAAPVGNLVAYAVISITSVVILCSITKIKIAIISVFIKPLVAAISCGIFAVLTYQAANLFIGDTLSTMAALVVAGLVYVASVLLLRVITRDDLAGLPKSEKLLAFLEKIHALG